MATQNENLARALEALHAASGGGSVVRSADLSQTFRTRLLKAGFLEEVMKGWLIVSNPAVPQGSSATWYGCFWEFVAKYLSARFGDDYCLAAEASVSLHTASTIIPQQISVTVKQPGAQTVRLKFDTSLFIYSAKEPLPAGRMKIDGLWAMDLPTSICRLAPSFYRNRAGDAEIALRMVRDSGALLRVLLDQNSTVIAGRLVGAYEFLGMPQFAAEIRQAMEAAGSIIRVTNPFEDDAPLLAGGSPRVTSPHVARLRMLWAEMRPGVIEAFAGCAPRSVEPADYLAEVEERYASDAYNSLSIEGYRVTPELIERVRSNDGVPGASRAGQSDLDTIAARGYYQAFRLVKAGIAEILSDKALIDVIDGGFQSWYREMFAPAVLAGLLQASQLAGYRSVPVYLRGSRHVPPSAEAVIDCMEEYLDLMRGETEPTVRAVLGHFIFVYIHPYPDGNGRIARFIMNAALASGGYPWTVIRNSRRNEYLAALEAAATGRDISPVARFVRQEMESGDGKAHA